MEHVIRSNVMDHLDKHNILTDNQHGFRQHRSCESQLILTTNDFAKSLDKGWQTDAIIMDFSKAFNVAAHQRLLLQLDLYGISGPTHTWISNFLMRRKQRVIMGGDSSDWVRVQSDVLQGTVLGQLLFLIYTLQTKSPPLCVFLLTTAFFTEPSAKTQMQTCSKRTLTDFVAGKRNVDTWNSMQTNVLYSE